MRRVLSTLQTIFVEEATSFARRRDNSPFAAEHVPLRESLTEMVKTPGESEGTQMSPLQITKEWCPAQSVSGLEPIKESNAGNRARSLVSVLVGEAAVVRKVPV